METMDGLECIGRIKLSRSKFVSLDTEERLNAMIAVLRNYNVAIVNERIDSEEPAIRIEILDIGAIDSRHMKDALKVLFKGDRARKNSVKLIHENKIFNLPDDMDECLDWFLIED